MIDEVNMVVTLESRNYVRTSIRNNHRLVFIKVSTNIL